MRPGVCALAPASQFALTHLMTDDRSAAAVPREPSERLRMTVIQWLLLIQCSATA